MSSRQEKIEHEVEQTLAAFNQAQRLSASPWFATRVQNRLQAIPEARPGMGLFAIRGLRPALLALIVMLNLVTAVVAVQRSEQYQETRQEYVASFASEYAFTTTDTLFMDEQ